MNNLLSGSDIQNYGRVITPTMVQRQRQRERMRQNNNGENNTMEHDSEEDTVPDVVEPRLHITSGCRFAGARVVILVK